MNFKEGMRRLALVAGGLGAVAGGYFSYLQVTGLNARRAHHKEFQSLLSTAAVQKDIQLLKTGLPAAKDPTPAFSYAHHGQDWFDAVAAIVGSTDGWAVEEGGVSRIYFDGKGEVNCIATADGLRVYPVEAPGIGSYVQIPVWPVLGFILPWASLMVFAWIVAGFSHKRAA